MCIAIVAMPGKRITKEVFDLCWRMNKDGFGIAYIDPKSGEVCISKAYMAAEHAWRAYDRLASSEEHSKFPMLIHFRATTVGRTDALNCHPFRVSGGAMIHNGTFFRMPGDISDSRYVADKLEKLLTLENIRREFANVQAAIGYNRVAFMHKDGQVTIFTEDHNNANGEYGQWHDGIWYSNGVWHGNYGGKKGDGIRPLSPFLNPKN